MSLYQFPHPWNPGYATPRYVMAEPQGRGTFTTKQLPRGTFGPVPSDRQIYNRTKWATPDYAQGRYGETARTTKMLPRRTVPLLAPDFFGRPGGAPTAMGSLAGNTLGCPTGCALGDAFAPTQDPVADYGKKGAAWILSSLRKIPKARQGAELKGLLDRMDTSLYPEVERKIQMYSAKGHPPRSALRRALSATLANSLADDFMRLKNPLAGSGAVSYDRRDPWFMQRSPRGTIGQGALGSWWNPVDLVKSGMKAGVTGVGMAAKGVQKLGGLACQAANSKAAPAVGAGIGAFYGSPQVGAAGAVAAKGVCSSGSSEGTGGAAVVPGVTPMPAPAPLPLVPIALGGAALVLAVLAFK